MTTTTPNLTIWTPVQIDTELARLALEAARAEQRVLSAMGSIRYALGDRKRGYGRDASYATDDNDAITRARAAGNAAVLGLPAFSTMDEVVAAFDRAMAALFEVTGQAERYEAEFTRRGGWSRFFTVSGGHIHSSTSCSTCNKGRYATRFVWNPELSGLTEADAVAKLGPTLCTVCFPSAPVEWTVGEQKPDTSCPGSGEAPVAGTVARFPRNSYGQCPSCDDRPIVKADGTLRKHQPKRSDR